MTATAYTVAAVVLAGCIAYAASVLPGRHRTAVLRARWAWRCRGKPVPGDGEGLTREEIQVLGNIEAGRDVRSRT